MAVNQNKAQARKQRQVQEEKRKQYEKANASAFKIFLIIFIVTALAALISLIVMLATDAVYIHNTDYTENRGREVAVSGAAFLKALFTGNYASADAGYDDLAVPFYFYAKSYCPPAAVFTLLSLLAQILTIALTAIAILIAIRKKDFAISIFTLGASVLTAVFAIAQYAVCMAMSGSQILPVYCNGNPACSVQSDLVGGLILSIVMVAGNIFAVIKFAQLKKMKKQI